MGKTKANLEFVELLLQVTHGPYTGRRYKWRGYFNTQDNAKRSFEALRAAGWRGTRFNDWRGLDGRTECQIVIVHEKEQPREDRKPQRTFARVAFINRVPKLKIDQPLGTTEIDALSRDFADMIANTAPRAVDVDDDAGDEVQDEAAGF